MNETPIKFFGVCNSRNRYYLPSKKNFFGCLNIEYCLIDTGCSTLLLPLSHANLDEILLKYASNFYIWTVSSSKGTGALSSPTLKISHSQGFKVSLMTDLYSNKISLDYLRFHISPSIAERLILAAPITAFGKEKLKNFLNQIGILKILSPSVKITMERHQALIGQWVLSKFCLIQHQMIIAAIAGDSSYLTNLNVNEEFFKLINLGESLIQMHFGEEEFNDLEDEENESDSSNIRKDFLEDDNSL